MPRPASPPQRQSSAFTVAFWTADPYQILFWNLPILYIFKLHHTLFTMPKQKYSRCSLLGLTMTLNASSASFQCKSLTIWHTCDEIHISFIVPKLIFIPIHLINQRNLKFFTYQKLSDYGETSFFLINFELLSTRFFHSQGFFRKLRKKWLSTCL